VETTESRNARSTEKRTFGTLDVFPHQRRHYDSSIMDGLAAKLTSFKLRIAMLMCFNVGCSTQTGVEKDVSPSTPTLQNVEVLRVAERDEVRTVVFYGKLIAEETAALRFSIAGKVDRVEAAVGDRKKEGEIRAVIAQPELTAKARRINEPEFSNRSPGLRPRFAVPLFLQPAIDSGLPKDVINATNVTSGLHSIRKRNRRP
jgi:hypothetical protein